MNEITQTLLGKIKALEEELETEMAQRRAVLQVTAHNGRIAFSRAVHRHHREFKVRLSHYVLGARPLVLVTAPIIYLAIVPFVALDLCVTLYQAVCFPVYGICSVRRADYLVFDRAQLGYLNLLEKLNCCYCSYANGLIAYVREIASRTEQYWCPIKHAQRILTAHGHYQNFLDFGDAEGYRTQLAAVRKQLGRQESVGATK